MQTNSQRPAKRGTYRKVKRTPVPRTPLYSDMSVLLEEGHDSKIAMSLPEFSWPGAGTTLTSPNAPSKSHRRRGLHRPKTPTPTLSHPPHARPGEGAPAQMPEQQDVVRLPLSRAGVSAGGRGAGG